MEVKDIYINGLDLIVKGHLIYKGFKKMSKFLCSVIKLKVLFVILKIKVQNVCHLYLYNIILI